MDEKLKEAVDENIKELPLKRLEEGVGLLLKILQEDTKKFKLSWDKMIQSHNIYKILVKAEPYFKREIAKQIFDDSPFSLKKKTDTKRKVIELLDKKLRKDKKKFLDKGIERMKKAKEEYCNRCLKRFDKFVVECQRNYGKDAMPRTYIEMCVRDEGAEYGDVVRNRWVDITDDIITEIEKEFDITEIEHDGYDFRMSKLSNDYWIEYNSYDNKYTLEMANEDDFDDCLDILFKIKEKEIEKLKSKYLSGFEPEKKVQGDKNSRN